MDVAYLLAAFEDGIELSLFDQVATVRTMKIASLNLPDGRVVATDPFTGPDRMALAWKLEPGSYDVILSLAEFEASEDKAVLAVKLVVSERVPVQWVLATTPDQDPSQLADDEIYGYPVDSGTGALMSPQSAVLFDEQMLDRFGNLRMDFFERVDKASLQNAAAGFWIDLHLDDVEELNAVLGPSGYGDGFYASYWGLDAEGAIVCLVTDFGVFPVE